MRPKINSFISKNIVIQKVLLGPFLNKAVDHLTALNANAFAYFYE